MACGWFFTVSRSLSDTSLRTDVPLPQMQDLIYRTLEPVAAKWFRSFSREKMLMRSVGVCELVDLDLITDVRTPRQTRRDGRMRSVPAGARAKPVPARQDDLRGAPVVQRFSPRDLHCPLQELHDTLGLPEGLRVSHARVAMMRIEARDNDNAPGARAALTYISPRHGLNHISIKYLAVCRIAAAAVDRELQNGPLDRAAHGARRGPRREAAARCGWCGLCSTFVFLSC